MLNFLRKHQKVLFIFVAIFTIASFLFFGTYSAMQPSMASNDRAIGKTIDGKRLMQEEVALLVRFLSTSFYERQLFEKGGTPNLLNDGVVQKDFLETGFAVMLSEQRFDLLKEDEEKRLEHAKRFGYNTLEDWFGRSFLNSIAQVILNGAALAKEKGYFVSREEARTALKANLREASLQLGNKQLTEGQLEEIYLGQIAALHWQEEKVVEVWQKVMLFRKVFRDSGTNVIVDPFTHRSIASFTAEQIKIDLYKLPPELELKNFRDLLKLQIYLEAVSPGNGRKDKAISLGLPVLFSSIEELEKRSPELVQMCFDVEMKTVTVDQLAENLSLKDVYFWEVDPENWEKLVRVFPILQNAPSLSKNERYDALEKLSNGERAGIDRYVKKEIVKKNPRWLEDAYTKTAKKSIEISLRVQGGDLPFEGVSDRDALRTLLMGTPEGSTVDYSPDDEHYYQITMRHRPGAQEIVTFGEAKEDGTLDLLLDRHLVQVYPDVRKKHPALFGQREGSWKPLGEVQDLVGAEVYADLLQKIEEEALRYGISWPKDSRDSLDIYARYRLITHGQETLSALRTGSVEGGWIQTSVSDPSVSKQWRFLKEEHVFKRKDIIEPLLSGIFEEKIDSWSNILVANKPGALNFYRIREKIKSGGNIDGMVGRTCEILSLDLQRVIFSELLEKLTTQNLLIAISESPEES